MIKLIETLKFPTRYGEFLNSVYQIESSNEPYTKYCFAIYTPETLFQTDPLVRIHSSCVFSEVLGSLVCDCSQQLVKTIKLFHQRGGILLYIDQEGRSHGLFNKVRELKIQEAGFDTVEASLKLGLKVDARVYTSAAAILKDLKVTRIKLVTNNPLKLKAMEDLGIEVLDRVSMEVPCNINNQGYLKTKKEILGHLLTKI